MASPTFEARALVLKKTKLGESDLIVTMLDHNDRLLKAVAKGARKPNGRFSAHLELFNVLDLFLVKGKNLDIVTESRLIEKRGAIHIDPIYGAAASCVGQLAEKTLEPGLEIKRFFDLVNTCLVTVDGSLEDELPLLISAFMLKTSAFNGTRPALDRCCICGTPLNDFSGGGRSGHPTFSFTEGGLVCDECAPACETTRVAEAILGLSHTLLMSKFEDVGRIEVSKSATFDLLQVCHQWIMTHFGFRIKSLDMFSKMFYV